MTGMIPNKVRSVLCVAGLFVLWCIGCTALSERTKWQHALPCTVVVKLQDARTGDELRDVTIITRQLETPPNECDGYGLPYQYIYHCVGARIAKISSGDKLEQEEVYGWKWHGEKGEIWCELHSLDYMFVAEGYESCWLAGDEVISWADVGKPVVIKMSPEAPGTSYFDIRTVIAADSLFDDVLPRMKGNVLAGKALAILRKQLERIVLVKGSYEKAPDALRKLKSYEGRQPSTTLGN